MPGEAKAVVASLGFTPFQVLSMNPQRFNEVFLEWRFNTWLASKKELSKEVLADSQNATRFDQLAKKVAAGAIVPYVGAGMSFLSGFKLWADFLHELREHCEPEMTEADLNFILRVHGYEEAAEHIIDRIPPRLYDMLFEDMTSKASWDTVQGAVLLLPHIFRGNALTTNFDTVLEIAYERRDQMFREVLHGREITKWPTVAMQYRTCLLKLHGHATNAATRVLSRSEYEDAYALGCGHRLQMEDVVKHSAFLFLGCGLSDDRTLKLIKDVYNENRLETRSYAILPLPDDVVTKKRREAFLAERAIFPIWYGEFGKTGASCPHDAYVEALLVELLDRQGLINELTVRPDVPSHQIGESI